ncbi:MAG: glycoside hydrolase family 65 protein [Chloroflexota bacterium]
MSRTSEVVKPIYPPTEWEIIETEFKPEHNYRNESVFALGNGYIGMRGNFEEGYAGVPGTGLEGNYLNGFYESEVIKYPETAYGFAEKSQTMLNVTNSKIIKLYLEGEAFSLFYGEVLDYRRVLNLKMGLLERNVAWRSPSGREVKIEITRLVSFQNKHLSATRFQVTPLNFSGEITLVTALDGDVTNLTTGSDPRLGSGLQGRVLSIEDQIADADFGALRQRTQHSGLELVCAMKNHITTDCEFQIDRKVTDAVVSAIYTVNAQQNAPIQLCKYISYVTTQDYASAELLEKAKAVVNGAEELGFEELQSEQVDYLTEFWNDADIVIKGDALLQQGVRFNMFHLLQSVGRDGKTNIAAKGLTGEGYEGHYFWDSEMYVVPFFLHTHPEISRKLLEYRYSILDKARQRARQMSHPTGALFAWRTINGEECSAYFPAGTAQFHINADIAFAVNRYVDATGDHQFMIDFGAEILFETARFWADYGDFIPRKGGKFCINGVTGPDEYTAIVDNNCYTNLMAKENLQNAYNAAQWMQQKAKDAYQKLVVKMGLEQQEFGQWKKAADEMYIPYDEVLGIYKQDDTFLDKAPWDFANTPEENYPLLIHYHPLVIYRHQVCKQADFVLALFLLGHQFAQEDKKKNYDFYEKVTTHDSSLSTCIFSIVASEIGYHDKAYQYFMNTARMDLDDFHGNVKDGVHIANMAGTWMCVVNGFGGMRTYGDVLSLNPYLPAGWDEYQFKVNYKGCTLSVRVDKTQVTYELLKGNQLEIAHQGEKLQLTNGKAVHK